MAIRRILGISCLASALLAGLALQARGDERAATEALLQEAEREPGRKIATAEVVAHAREALERATRFRSAGDETHAKLADGLARELAETARDLAKTVDAEKQAEAARRNAIDAGAHSERERALLEEGISRNGRLRAELDEAERTRKEAPMKTNAAGAAAGADAGAPSKTGSSAGSNAGSSAGSNAGSNKGGAGKIPSDAKGGPPAAPTGSSAPASTRPSTGGAAPVPPAPGANK
jgi:hypothetical protein